MGTVAEWLKETFTMTELHEVVAVFSDCGDDIVIGHDVVYGANGEPDEMGNDVILAFGRPFASKTSYRLSENPLERNDTLNIRLTTEENDWLVEWPLKFS